MICAIVTVSMVFVSLTSAYIVRRGLPTFDDSTRTYFRDWGSVQLPWVLLFINTAILLVSSLTMEAHDARLRDAPRWLRFGRFPEFLWETSEVFRGWA